MCQPQIHEPIPNFCCLNPQFLMAKKKNCSTPNSWTIPNFCCLNPQFLMAKKMIVQPQIHEPIPNFRWLTLQFLMAKKMIVQPQIHEPIPNFRCLTLQCLMAKKRHFGCFNPKFMNNSPCLLFKSLISYAKKTFWMFQPQIHEQFPIFAV